MQFSFNSLKKYLIKHYQIDLNYINSKHQLSNQFWLEKLTMQGLEVEEELFFPKVDDKIIVGQIMSIAPHPNADRLRVCQVKIQNNQDTQNNQYLQIVCGASNVIENAFVCVATTDSILHLADEKTLVIVPVIMRGVESHGMLCSASELGFTKELHAFLGIDAIADNGLLLLDAVESNDFIGKPIASLLDLDDVIVTIKLTPNRGDCLSLKGLGREMSFLVKQFLRNVNDSHIQNNIQTANPLNPLNDSYSSNNLINSDTKTWSNKCHSFAIAHLKTENQNSIQTPLSIKQALNRAGIRCISLLVDCSNWVMLETGQPLHTYDAKKIALPFTPKNALEGETITLLNQKVIEFKIPENLVIADAEKLVALAGIMGGLDTQVNDETTEIYVEAANFIDIRGADYQINSDAVFRFERGVDTALAVDALNYFYELLLSIDKNTIWLGGQVAHNNNEASLDKKIAINFDAIEKRIGFTFNHQEALENLACIGIDAGSDGKLNIPSHRFDLKDNDDLSEEVLRQVGYDKIPTQLPKRHLKIQELPFHVKRRRFIKENLSALGYQETIHLSFSNTDDALKNGGVALKNPMVSHQSHLRGHLLTSLLHTWKQQVQSQLFHIKLFEYSRVFKGLQVAQQPYYAAGLWAGSIHDDKGIYWNAKNRNTIADFYHVKGELEQLFPALEYKAIHDDARFHPTRCAGLFYQSKQIGVMGELHPLQLNELGITLNKQVHVPILFELNIEAYPMLELLELRHQTHEFSRFPRIGKDMAFLLESEVSWGDVVASLEQNNQLEYVQDYQLFDEFIPENSSQKSWAIRMNLQASDRTLTETEIHDAMNQCIDIIGKHHQGVLRDGK